MFDNFCELGRRGGISVPTLPCIDCFFFIFIFAVTEIIGSNFYAKLTEDVPTIMASEILIFVLRCMNAMKAQRMK